MTNALRAYRPGVHSVAPEAAASAPAAGDDLGDMLQRFLEPLLRLAGAQGGAVRVLDDASDGLQLVSVLGQPAEACRGGRAADRHCGYCGAAADGQRVIWATDLSGCAIDTEGGTGRPHSDQRMLVWPLQHRGRVLGVCNLYFSASAEPGAEVLALLESVGELLGMALANARLEAENLRARLTHERQAMAAEVHDSLAQSLTFVKMRMPLLRDAMLGRDDARALAYFDEVRAAVSQAHACLRVVLTHFRSPMDPQGLAHALDTCAEAFRRSTDTELEYVNGMPDLHLAPEDEAQVFHIVQEALTNVARHAAAQHTRLCIAHAPPGEVEIVVEDDGAGLPPTPAGAGTHYGLEIMQERARRIGGTLEVGPRRGGGTRVRLAFSVTAPQRAPLAQEGH